MANNTTDIFDTAPAELDPSFNLATRTDDNGAGTVYVGYATKGAATSAAAWYINRFVTTGTETVKAWANGSQDFDQVWDNRASLPYSS